MHAVMNGKHTDKFTFLLDINNVPSLYYPAIYLHAFITIATGWLLLILKPLNPGNFMLT